MAYDKVIDSAELEADLTAVADAIRTKGGTSETLAFPDGFVSAIEGIQAGGGSGDDTSFKDVIERTAVNPTLPSDLTKIGSEAFLSCSKLALTSLPDGVTTIEYKGFSGCYQLALTSLPASLTTIGKYAFDSCSRMTLTSLPDGVTTIDNSAFVSCTGITLTSLPASLTTIGTYAFRYCKGLTEITFKAKPTSGIPTSVFNGCTNLLTINVPWAEGEVENAPWSATNATINYNYTGG